MHAMQTNGKTSNLNMNFSLFPLFSSGFFFVKPLLRRDGIFSTSPMRFSIIFAIIIIVVIIIHSYCTIKYQYKFVPIEMIRVLLYPLHL